MRFLFLLLSVVLVVWLVRGLLRSMSSDERSASPPKTISSKDLGVLVVCAHCEVHLPRDEAVFDGDLAFCDETHLAAHRQRQTSDH